MKKSISSKKIVSIIITILLVLATRVYAANDSFETTLKADHSQVKRGENVIITIGLDKISIESGDKGIGSYTANIKFDSSVLEYVSIAGTDKWEKPSYQEGLILGVTEDGEVVENTQNIASITFKIKEDAKLGETSIELEKFSGSTGKTDVSADNKSIGITIVESNSGNDDGNNNDNENNNGNNSSNNNGNNSDNNSNSGNNGGNNNGNENNGVNNNGNNSSNDSGNNSDNNSNSGNHDGNNNSSTHIKDNTATSGKLPQTGEKSSILIVCIGLTMMCSVICYIKMK